MNIKILFDRLHTTTRSHSLLLRLKPDEGTPLATRRHQAALS